MTDTIIAVPTGAVVSGLREVTKRNAGEGWIQGVEVSGRVDLGLGLTFRATFTWQEGELDAYPAGPTTRVTEPVSRLMPLTGLAALRWEGDGGRWWAEVAGTVAGRQDRLSSGDRLDIERFPPGGTPGYDVYTVRGGWRPHGRVGLTVAVENVADRDYRVHGSGLNEPGRNVVVSADFRF